ncbi:MAG: endolytic transglycosylase MltG [Treponema sp.]|nr:endolytic transglycosylase MltG [Treponema sp.]
MIRKILLTCLIVFFVIILVLGGIGAGWWILSQKPVAQDQVSAISYKLEVPSGTGIKTVATQLESENIIRSRLVFYLLARKENLQMKAGVYEVQSSMGLTEIFEILESGRQEHLVVSIPEGLTLSKIAALLEAEQIISAQDFIRAAKNPLLLAEYQVPASSFEGYLFPDTYYFIPDMKAEAVVRMLVDTFFKKIAGIEGLATLSPQELFEVVTLASIVEREYQVTEEAPLIASVFKNRLKKNIGLYSCATVVYIITEIEGRPHPEIVTNKDLKLDSPYNTYKWAGLPPGPISNPGLIALSAAANPPKTPYYYFRVTNAGDGSHHFSEDFQEHVEMGELFIKRAAGN